MKGAPDQNTAEANVNGEERSGFEALLDSIGPFGLYQKVMCGTLIGISTFFCALTYYTQVMLLLTPPSSCRGVPSDHQSLDSCDILPVSTNTGNNSNGSGTVTGAHSVACTQWSYDTAQMFPTIASENDWLCADAWRPALVHALFWAGNVAGSWLWGLLSDTLGRRPASAAAAAVYALGGLLTLAAPRTWEAVLTARFVVGFSHHTVAHLPYMLAVEYCGAAYRTYPLLVLIATWGAAGALQPWLAYVLWSWRLLVIVTSAPLLVTLLLYRYIPESACWLLSQGRTSDAHAQLERAAAANGRQLDEALFKQVTANKGDAGLTAEGSGESLLTVRHYPRLLCKMALVTLLWMIACLCFYGHSQSTAHLGGSLFVSMSLGGAVEVPTLVGPILLQVLGRRRPMSLFFVTSGICGAIYIFASDLLPVSVGLALALAGRMLIMGAYSTCLQYGPELFPTTIRGQSLALYETMGGLAIFISPYIIYLRTRWAGLPMAILASLSLLAGALTLLLPETAGKPLPQTVADAGAEEPRAQTSVKA